MSSTSHKHRHKTAFYEERHTQFQRRRRRNKKVYVQVSFRPPGRTFRRSSTTARREIWPSLVGGGAETAVAQSRAKCIMPNHTVPANFVVGPNTQTQQIKARKSYEASGRWMVMVNLKEAFKISLLLDFFERNSTEKTPKRQTPREQTKSFGCGVTHV